mgnify:CR=1 FL=1
MEKVRFEAFNVEELRVLRRACYEAGAAFGDPGHTAAERATLDDLAPEILGGWYNPDMENELEQLVCVVENTPTAAAQDAQRWRYTAEEPPKEEDGDCCGRVLIAHAGAHCAVATSLQYAKENPEAVRVWMPLPKLPWEEKK